MPKHKQFLNSKKKPENRKNQGPETENEYLAAGVDYEEAGEKWRAGDAAKSSRFFVRSIETYSTGLSKFPRSFDLAYNKARLQYDVAQQPKLLRHLPTSYIDLLQAALISHRYALSLGQDSPDVLFNTAQILTSLAEATNEGGSPVVAERESSLCLFQEALELFQRCLSIQEFKFSEAQEHSPVKSESAPDSASESSATARTSTEEVWAMVEEPVTKDTLLDTVLAQLDTLIEICNSGSSRYDLTWIEEYYYNNLRPKISLYVGGTRRQQEASLTRARYVSALADAAFRDGRLGIERYEQELNSAFSLEGLDLTKDFQGLCDRADAELSFSLSALSAALIQAVPSETGQLSGICWRYTTRALNHLTAASKLPDAQNFSSIHLRRGDCEMLRLRLNREPFEFDIASKSTPTLSKNAEVYYRGAAVIARDSGNFDEQKEAEQKEAIAAALYGDIQKLETLIKSQREIVEINIEDMNGEGLLSEATSQELRRLLM